MPTDIQLTPEFKARVQELKDTFDSILNGQENAELGIYPVIINGETRGIRLGGKQAKEEGSACILASTHLNELAGLKAFSRILDLWQHAHNDKPALKDAALEGDIYLMFAGQPERMRELFTALLDPARETMSVEENTDFRERLGEDGSRANANRVRHDKKETGGYEQLNMADKALIADNDAFEQAVYRKCRLVLDIHSMSQQAEPLLIPHPRKTLFKGKPADVVDHILRGVARKWMAFAQNMGAADVTPHLSMDQHGSVFTGTEPDNESFRGLFEGGGPHNAPATWERGANAATGALATLWPQKLGYLRPAQHTTPRIHGRMVHFYLPDSPNARMHMPESAIHREEGAQGQNWHLLTGGEALPEAVVQKIRHVCGAEHAELKAGRLANGATLPKGAPVAYAYNEENQAVSLLVSPETGMATMFPAAARNLPPDREESIGVIGMPLPMEITRETTGGDWRNRAANSNTRPSGRVAGA